MKPTPTVRIQAQTYMGTESRLACVAWKPVRWTTENNSAKEASDHISRESLPSALIIVGVNKENA
jgi:hypothetical protein